MISHLRPKDRAKRRPGSHHTQLPGPPAPRFQFPPLPANRWQACPSSPLPPRSPDHRVSAPLHSPSQTGKALEKERGKKGGVPPNLGDVLPPNPAHPAPNRPDALSPPHQRPSLPPNARVPYLSPQGPTLPPGQLGNHVHHPVPTELLGQSPGKASGVEPRGTTPGLARGKGETRSCFEMAGG